MLVAHLNEFISEFFHYFLMHETFYFATLAFNCNILRIFVMCYLSLDKRQISTWKGNIESCTELDGRECSMIEISAVEGDPRSIIISYGPMPEGSDAIMEAGDTYEVTSSPS